MTATRTGDGFDELTEGLSNPWSGHYMEPAFLGFVHFALGRDDFLRQFQEETGVDMSPPKSPIDVAIDRATGRMRDVLQEFVNWCAYRHFGTPEDLNVDED